MAHFPFQEAQNKLNAKIAEPIFHRVRDVAPNKVSSISYNKTKIHVYCLQDYMHKFLYFVDLRIQKSFSFV